jgi:hypothetical protein
MGDLRPVIEFCALIGGTLSAAYLFDWGAGLAIGYAAYLIVSWPERERV